VRREGSKDTSIRLEGGFSPDPPLIIDVFRPPNRRERTAAARSSPDKFLARDRRTQRRNTARSLTSKKEERSMITEIFVQQAGR
jgi:hypothetical protein